VQTPSGDSSVVAFIYAGFGLALSESTPNVPVRACAQPLCRLLQSLMIIHYYSYGRNLSGVPHVVDAFHGGNYLSYTDAEVFIDDHYFALGYEFVVDEDINRLAG